MICAGFVLGSGWVVAGGLGFARCIALRLGVPGIGVFFKEQVRCARDGMPLEKKRHLAFDSTQAISACVGENPCTASMDSSLSL